MIEPRGLTLKQAATYIGVSADTIREAATHGELHPARIGGQRRGRLIFLKDDLDRFIEEKQQAFDQSRPK